MLREGVRLDRVRGGRQKYRRTTRNSSENIDKGKLRMFRWAISFCNLINFELKKT